MKEPFARLCITSTSGGGGKTLLSLGLARLWHSSNLAVKPFKKGPDYIDAAWLAMAADCPCTNLDPFFLTEPELLTLFQKAMLDAGSDAIAIIEGNRGLYDGLDETGTCSTSVVARTLACPVILCVDCSKSTRTMAAILNGVINFEPDLQFGGIILNKIGSSRHESALRKAIERHLDLKILGAMPRLAQNPLPERHMGLVSHGPQLRDNAKRILDDLAAFVKNNCDTNELLSLAQTAAPLPLGEFPAATQVLADAPLIGYVRDAALWFYYPENLQLLEQAGAKLIQLSLVDSFRPEDWANLDGLYLGGGFPEDHADAIANSRALPLIGKFVEAGMPVYAECGGMMILCESFEKSDRSWRMAGVFGGSIRWRERPQGLGYVQAAITGDNPFFAKGARLRGHEFHYSFWTGSKQQFRMRLERGRGMTEACDGILKNNAWGSYTHIFAPSVPEWAENFVKLARQFKQVKGYRQCMKNDLF